MSDNDRGRAMESMEALYKGQKGDKGNQGNQGNQGNPGSRGEQGASRLPLPQARAIVYLVVVAFLINGAGLFWQAHQANANKAAERRASLVVEQKLCSTLGRLAALKPPTRADLKPGAPFPPSFAYENDLHVTLAQLGADIGCKETP